MRIPILAAIVALAWVPGASAAVGWAHVDVPSLGQVKVKALGHGLLVSQGGASRDGGATWNAGTGGFLPQVVDPRDPMRAIALTVDPWHATNDGGLTWPVVTRPRAPAGYAIPMSGFLFDPGHPSRLVGVQQEQELDSSGVPAPRSSLTLWTSDDAGLTWRSGAAIEDATGAVVLANPDGSDARVVTVSWTGSTGFLRQSFDDGASWSDDPVDLLPDRRLSLGEAHLIADPAGSGVLFATTLTHAWRSGDGGLHWARAAFPVEDEPELFISATHPGLVLALSGGRIWRSLDHGATFRARAPAGAAATGGFSEDSDGTVYASGAPGVESSFDAGLTWHWPGVSGLPLRGSSRDVVAAGASLYTVSEAGALRIVGGRLVAKAARPMRLETLTATSDRNLVAVDSQVDTPSVQTATLVRSTDGGATWHSAGSICENGYGTQLAAVPGTQTVYAQGSACKAHPAAEGQVTLERSDNGGRSWRTVAGTRLRAPLVPVPGRPDLLYSTTAGGDPRATVSRDGGRSWRLLHFVASADAVPTDVLAATSRVLYVHGHTAGNHGAIFTVRPDGRILSTLPHRGAVAVSASDPAVAVAFLAFHRLRYTIDGGRRWRVLPSPPLLARYGCRGLVLAGDGRVVLTCSVGLWETLPGAVR
jgi:hypothetical protein